MAETQPKVGDAAMVDGEELVVTAVEPNGKPIVKMGCAKAQVAAEATASIRAKYAKPLGDVEKRLKKAMETPGGHSARMLATLPIKVEMEAMQKELSAELNAVPQGTTVSANLRNIEFVEAGQVWSVRGRLLSFADRQRAKGRTV